MNDLWSNFALALADAAGEGESLATTTTGVTAARTAADADAPAEAAQPLPVVMQVCLPAELWNWPVAPLGSSPVSMYEFCSWVPASPNACGAYEPTAMRVSDSYQLFLEALPSSPIVASALGALTKPANQTLVPYDNGSAMMPTWIVDNSPAAFVASVAGKKDLAATIRVNLSGQENPPGATDALFEAFGDPGTSAPVPFAKGDVDYIDLHADAWGTVAVRPGGWFNGSLVSLRSNGPFSDGYKRGSFFGANGILRAMITGIRVGLNVSVVSSMAKAMAVRLRETAANDSIVRVAGLSYAGKNVSFAPGPSAEIESVSFAASAAVSADGSPVPENTPVIVGVEVATLG